MAQCLSSLVRWVSSRMRFITHVVQLVAVGVTMTTRASLNLQTMQLLFVS